jgi:topoisomerase-4 subunit A
MQAKKLPMVADIRDESDHEDPIRLRVSPRSSRVDKDALMSHLLATTELEKTYRLNLNVIGLNRRPQTLGLVDLLRQWLEFRKQTVMKRLNYRLERINERLHVLEGLLIVYLHLDEVIRIIRQSDDPEQELMRRFELSAVQVEAILQIRLRQLARLEELKLKKEKGELEAEKREIEEVLSSEVRLKRLLKKELKSDAEKFGDRRRTRIVERKEAQAIKERDLAPADPLTVVLSANGWVRAAKGHDIDPESLAYKPGDSFLSAARGKSNQFAVFLDTAGRTYSLEAHSLPSARGQGEPITARFALPPGARFVSVAIGPENQHQLLASDFGYGFLTEMGNLQSKNQKGKAMLKVPGGANALPSLAVDDAERQLLAAFTTAGHLLVITLRELPVLPKGKGNKIIQIPKKRLADREEILKHLVVFDPQDCLVVTSGKRTFKLTPETLSDYTAERGRRGKKLPRGFRSVDRVEREAADTGEKPPKPPEQAMFDNF